MYIMYIWGLFQPGRSDRTVRVVSRGKERGYTRFRWGTRRVTRRVRKGAEMDAQCAHCAHGVSFSGAGVSHMLFRVVGTHLVTVWYTSRFGAF